MKKMGKSKLIVFAIHRPYRAPNEKYRWMQYASYIEQYFDVEYLFLINENDDQILFQSNNYLLKSWVFIKTFIKRCWQIKKMKEADVVIIYRELHWFHFPLWLKWIKNKVKKIVFDFDDAIFLNTSNVFVNIIKQPYHKTIHFIKNSDVTIAGNTYLLNFSKKYNSQSILIPTIVDTTYFIPLHPLRHQQNKVVIGWMGSHSTLSHLLNIVPILKLIQKKYPFVEYKFVAKKMFIPELNVICEDWNKDTEVEVLNTFDIGIMPLPNDEWSKGKCGLKLLTYLSCEIPCVASDVGVNAEIIYKTNGGYVVSDDQQWIGRLSQLITNEELRKQLGKSGRKGVIQHYSVEKWKSEFLKTLMIEK